MPEITDLLVRWRAGDDEAGREVVGLTYAELRAVAMRQIRRERRDHSLQATGLLHEAWLRLVRRGPGAACTREDFMGLMAAEMRRRLIDYARRRRADKRGGGIRPGQLASSEVPALDLAGSEGIEKTLESLDRALDQLNAAFPRAARVVELRFLAGLTTAAVAVELGLSEGTVKREWRFARAWLAAALARTTGDAA